MTYAGLFSRYQPLKGKDWLRKLKQEDPEAVDVFVNIGLQELDHGKMGGQALFQQKGSDHMRQIGRIGAIVTNSWKMWNRLMQEELTREFGVTFDF